MPPTEARQVTPLEQESFCRYAVLESFVFAMARQLDAGLLKEHLAAEREALVVFLGNSQFSESECDRILLLLDRMVGRIWPE